MNRNRLAQIPLLCILIGFWHLKAQAKDIRADVVKDFPGRVVWSGDGNEHDTDDWLASPWMLAMFKAAGMEDKLVFSGYNNHVWSTTQNHAQIYEANVKGTATRWGMKSSILYDEKYDATAATDKMVAEINKSTSSNPLWLVAAGPIETIGRAIDKAGTDALKHVTMLSHSTWNTDHASKDHKSKYTLAYIQNKVSYKKIKDQNGNENGSMTTQGLKRKTAVMDFLKDHKDARMQWLWTCRKMPEYERPNYQKGFYDYSDAGMAYWLITGADNGGDEDGTPKKTTDLLEAYITHGEYKITALKGKGISGKKPKLSVLPQTGGNRVVNLGQEADWVVYSLQGEKLGGGRGQNIDMQLFPQGLYLINSDLP